MSDELICAREGDFVRLTLNRPQKANALSATLVERLLDAIDESAAGTRLLVLDGAGPHFCAGFDFGGYQEQSEGDLALRFIRIEALLQRLYHAPFATLALAQGQIFGAGADLVASCGVRVAAPGTTFRMPGLHFGVVLGTRRLAHRIGADRARAILSQSRTFDAEEALALDFVTRIAAQADWPQVVAEARATSALLSPEAAAALYRQTTVDTRAEDMTALANSVSAPGLKEHIRRYRDAGK